MERIALIPARSGSVRVKDKNIKLLGGLPLIAYTIEVAIKAKVYSKIYCLTDSEEYADIAIKFGAEVPGLRPTSISTSTSPDIDWVKWVRALLSETLSSDDQFTILRPTNPFRTVEMIKAAHEKFENFGGGIDSLRAVSECSEHPGKMWMLEENIMLPLLPFKNGGVPWHSSQKAALPKVFVQNASLEIFTVSTVDKFNSISGVSVMPFICKGIEGFDINSEEDWILAEYYLKQFK